MITVPDVTPPGGWTYTEPATGFTMSALVLPHLRDQVLAHRKSNRALNLDLEEGWWERVQAEMCLENPSWMERYCDPNAAPPAPERREIGVRDLLIFFRAMRRWVITHGMQTVDSEEQERRAAICRKCPHNVTVKGCSGCQGVTRWLAEFMSRENAEREDPGLHNCGVCGCVLKLKTLLPRDVIDATTDPLDEYPDHCWVPNNAP